MCERDWSICSSNYCCGRFAEGSDSSAFDGKIMGYVCSADAESYNDLDGGEFVFECIDKYALGGLNQASTLFVASTLILGLL